MTFAALAPRLYDLGFEVIPIPAGEKGPTIKGWQSIEITKGRVAAWAREWEHANIGIRTKSCPAIDVDVTDARLAAEIERIATVSGLARCVRVGSAPKRLLACQAPRGEDGAYRPFRKTVLKLAPPGVDVNTRDKAEAARIQKLEVLGLGQQFVAYGRHPKGNDYTWTSLDELHEVALTDLPLLTPEGVETLFSAVSSAAGRMGWTSQVVGSATHATVSDDALLSYAPRADDIDAEKAAAALTLVSDAQDYDHWVKVGMALHHQFSGALDGLTLWHEWSSKADNYDAKALDARWESFHQMPASQTPITFRYVLKYANEGKAAKKRERLDEIRSSIAACQSTDRLYGRVSAEIGKLLENEIEVDLIVDAILKRGKELDGAGPTRATIKRAVRLAYLTTRVNHKCPDWLTPYVYVENDESFYNVLSHTHLSERAFNMLHNRMLLSEAEKAAGQIQPEYPASVVAMNKYELKSVQGFRYMPGAAELFEIEGISYANSFDTRSMPTMPETYSASGLMAVELMKQHLAALFGGREFYANLLLYWIAFKVQNPEQHPHWAILIQGAEGGGKTVFSELLCGVLGSNNVGVVSPTAIKGNFTGWGEGALVNIVEEIRLHGENRWEIVDKVKPYITNALVPIRKMRTDEYKVQNFTAYLLFTNHADAMPLAQMDRRFCILSTAFQTKTDIQNFNKANPSYYDRLFSAMRANFGELRKWLLEIEIPEWFKPYAHAPDTDAKELMRDAARGDEADGLEDLIEHSNDPLVNCAVLSASRLREMAADQMTVIPPPNRLGNVLFGLGYAFVGRARHGDERVRLWSKTPGLFESKDLTGWLKSYLDGSMFDP